MTPPRRELLFASPVYLSRPPGTERMRAELRDIFLNEARTTAGVRQSNVGGWHSAPDLLERRSGPFPALATLLVDGLRAVLAAECAARGRPADPALRIAGFSWAMVMERGHYSQPHHHGEAHWACAFYVDAGEPDGAAPAGHLSFLDPRGSVGRADPLDLFPGRQDVRPVDGLLVYFPGWLLHHVHPHQGARPRVSISANLVLGA